ncbi:hypothetical protein HOLleu_02125 [Holothuria leucospilota]|uniref:Tyrosine-protein kinase ephrin type A/B receptor-like domain-containing protein n=1 Tax=Holothuria leucospilota TaxID=206669 RepID=A0A9Q1CRR0_HOLLE|nr:hypothetical protein HOLleu_02125 [Holothuria leucospilota]
MFSNHLDEISNKSFGVGSLLELQVYKNNIKSITAEAFLNTGSRVNIYLQCYHLTGIPFLYKNLTATCVTGSVLPKIRFQSGYSTTVKGNLRQGGFNCSFNKKILECTPCPSGFYGNRLNGCQACPQGGFYQDDVGRINCSLCSKGTFVNHSGGKSKEECALCPEGTDFTRHAGNRACFCKINYARTHRFQGCSICLEEGVNCVDDFKSLHPGYYWNWSFPGANITEYSSFVFHLKNDSVKYNEANQQYRYKIPQAHKCPIRLSCENQNSSSAYGIKGRCKVGYRGWLCSKCQKTFYSVLNTCFPCPDKIWIILEAAAILCLVLGVYLLILWQGKEYDRNKRSGRTILDKITSQMKIVLGFYQVVGELFESFHDVTWVGPLAFIGEILSFLKINILRVVIRPHCFSEKLYIDAKLQFIISLCFPIAVFSILVSCYQVWKLYLKFRKPSVVDRGKKLKELKNKFLTYAILLLFITYPPTCDVIFKLYPGACKTFYIFKNDTSVYITLLRSDFDLKCETLKTYQLLAYVATVAYVVSFPFVLLLLLRRYCKKHATNDHQGETIQYFEPHLNDTVNENEYLLSKRCESDVLPVWVKFLCENYKPQYWYWEIIELARKVTQTVLVTLLGWEDTLTKLLTIGTSVLFLTLHARLSPMMSNFEQRLQMFSLSAIFINVLIASVPIPQNYQAPLSTILIVINMIIILIIAGEVVFYFIRFIRRKFLHVSKN